MKITNFNDCIVVHMRSLRSHALKFTNDVDDADDLLQDTLLKASRFIDKFEDNTNLKGWLFVIMKNTFINSFRKDSRRRQKIVQEEEISSANLLHSSIQNDATSHFTMADIQNALSKLPICYAGPFVKYFEGYKYEEIAEEFGIPLGTVKTRIHQARLNLKKYLKQYKQR